MANIFDIFKEISGEREAKANQPITHLIVGLGNPGDKYFHTRHNAGFLMMDYLSQKANIRVDKVKFKALVGDGEIGGRRVLLMKPQTFMNHSGEAVAEAAKFYKIAPENIIVISDDITQEPGKIRIRKKGSAGGHNGLKDIIAHLSSDAFPRIRLGVGEKPHPDYDLAAWVLSDFTKQEQQRLFSAFACVSDGIRKMLDGDFDGAQQLCNSHKPTENGN